MLWLGLSVSETWICRYRFAVMTQCHMEGRSPRVRDLQINWVFVSNAPVSKRFQKCTKGIQRKLPFSCRKGNYFSFARYCSEKNQERGTRDRCKRHRDRHTGGRDRPITGWDRPVGSERQLWGVETCSAFVCAGHTCCHTVETRSGTGFPCVPRVAPRQKSLAWQERRKRRRDPPQSHPTSALLSPPVNRHSTLRFLSRDRLLFLLLSSSFSLRSCSARASKSLFFRRCLAACAMVSVGGFGHRFLLEV